MEIFASRQTNKSCTLLKEDLPILIKGFDESWIIESQGKLEAESGGVAILRLAK
jgi:hypothetical protein